MSQREMERVREEVQRRLSRETCEKLVSEFHELAGHVALGDKARVFQILQALDKIFEADQ